MSRDSRHQVAFHWVKTGGLPEWPCFTVAEPPSKGSAKVKAYFFGEESACQVKWRDLVPFLLNFQRRSSQAHSLPFATAVTHAVNNFTAFHSLSDNEFAEQAGISLPALRRLRERRVQTGVDVHKVIVADALPKAAARRICPHLLQGARQDGSAASARSLRASSRSAATGARGSSAANSGDPAPAPGSDDGDGLFSVHSAASRVQAVLDDAGPAADADGVLPLSTQRAILKAVGDCIFASVPSDSGRVLSLSAPRVPALRLTLECIPATAPTARRKALLLLRSAVAGADLSTQVACVASARGCCLPGGGRSPRAALARVNSSPVHGVVSQWLLEAVRGARSSSEEQRNAFVALAKAGFQVRSLHCGLCPPPACDTSLFPPPPPQYLAELPHRLVSSYKADVRSALREAAEVAELVKTATNFHGMMQWRQWIGSGQVKISELASKQSLPTGPPTEEELMELFPLDPEEEEEEDREAGGDGASSKRRRTGSGSGRSSK